MTKVVSHHDTNLGLPLGGPMLRPGIPTVVQRWSVIKGHPVVKAWLAAKAIEVIGEAVPAASPAPVEDVERVALDPDADGRTGGSLSMQDGGLDELRARYTEMFGSEPDGRWGEKRLQDAVDAKLAE